MAHKASERLAELDVACPHCFDPPVVEAEAKRAVGVEAFEAAA